MSAKLFSNGKLEVNVVFFDDIYIKHVLLPTDGDRLHCSLQVQVCDYIGHTCLNSY